MSTRNIIIIGGVVLALIVALIVWKRQSESDATKVTAEKAELRTIVESVSANGKIEPVRQVKISPEVPGEIILLPVIEGQKVDSGTLLAKINPDLYMASVNRAEASVNSAMANVSNSKARLAQSNARLINAEAVFKRQEKLYKDQVISEAEYDQSKAEFDVAKAEVEAAKETLKSSEYNAKSSRATLKEATDNLKRTTLYAPMNGTVSGLVVEQGERVVGTAQMAGTDMMVVADLTSMEVNAEVNESDIVKISLGDEAEVEVDAYVNRKFKGIVTEIANSSQSGLMQGSDQITVFSVKVQIVRSSYEDLIDQKSPHLSPFRPGMSATVEIFTGSVENTISVPIQAVTIRPDSNATENTDLKEMATLADDELIECVFVIEHGKSVLKPVSIGLQDNKYMQITSGLDTSDMVITGPYALVSKKLEEDEEVEVGDRSDVFSVKD
jgi:HlyD family secretion protein